MVGGAVHRGQVLKCPFLHVAGRGAETVPTTERKLNKHCMGGKINVKVTENPVNSALTVHLPQEN